MKRFAVMDLALPVALVVLLVIAPPTQPASTQGRTSVGDAQNVQGVANATQNLTSALNRLVMIVAVAAGAVVTLAWARVAVSWFSNDPTKKMGAKDRVKDAALGTFILLSAVTGLAWGLAHWVLTGV